MKNVLTISTILTVVAVAVFAFFAFTAVSNTASAWDTDFGDGCCDTGGSTSGGSSFNDDDHNDRLDDDPEPQPAICKFLKVEGIGDGGADKTVHVPYGTTSVSLRYNTLYANKVTLNGNELSKKVNLDGRSTKINGDTTFKLVAKNAYGSDSCVIHVDVKEPATPKCVSFAANPTVLPAGGGSTSITWETKNAADVQIKNVTTGKITDVVNLNNTSGRSFNVTENTTFRLLVIGQDGSKDNSCEATVKVKEEQKVASCDWFNADPTYLPYGGGQVNLSWATTNANSVYINNGVGNVAADGSKSVNVSDDTTFTLTATGTNGNDSCTVNVNVKDWNPEPKECEMQITKSVDKTDAKPGDHLTYTIKVKNIGTGDCTGGGVKIFDYIDGNLSFVSQTHTSNLSAGYSGDVYDSSKHLLTWNGHTLNPGESGTISWTGKVKTPNQCGDYKVYNTAKVTAKELNNFGTWISSNKVQTTIDYDCEQKTASCDWFDASPTSLPYGGGDVELSWATTNAQSVSINNGVGTVSADGSETVYVSEDTTFTLTVTGANNDDTCTASVDVKPQHKVASCDDFYITPSTLSKAGDVTLHWETTNAESVYINNGVGNVADDGSETVYVSGDTTFTLTVDGKNDSDTCTAKVRIEEEEELTCDDVDFRASDTKVKKGTDVTLYWDVTNDVDDVYINNGIGDVARNGQETVEINSDTTYRITIENEYSSRTCSLDIDVDSGGGGSSSPRCDLDISDFKINKGDKITLEWETTRATDVKIKDDHGNVLLDTDDMNSDEKRDFLDGEMSLKPSKDTEYTLIASRGSKDRTCRETVKVDDDDDVVVYEVRDQQPLVAGVYLTQVPYTGFEAGPALTTLFYGLLTLWALFVAYVLVIRRDSILGFSLPFARTNVVEFDQDSEDEFRKKVQMLAAKHSHNPWNNLR